jgi:hypothetical protein
MHRAYIEQLMAWHNLACGGQTGIRLYNITIQRVEDPNSGYHLHFSFSTKEAYMDTGLM